MRKVPPSQRRKKYERAVCPVCRREFDVMPASRGYCSRYCHKIAGYRAKQEGAKASP